MAHYYRQSRGIDNVPLPGDPPSFQCPGCGAVSYHPEDIRNEYCGRCHDFTAEPRPVDFKSYLAAVAELAQDDDL